MLFLLRSKISKSPVNDLAPEPNILKIESGASHDSVERKVGLCPQLKRGGADLLMVHGHSPFG